MNFLELVDALRMEAGTSGDKISTLSENFLQQTEVLRLKRWVAVAWNAIQMKEKWNFLRYEGSCLVPANATLVIPDEFEAGDVADWTGCTAKVAKLSEPESKAQWLTVWGYRDFREGPGKDPTRTGRPSSIAVDTRLESLHIAPAADQDYYLYYDYWATPQELKEDTDVPIMPRRFHELIVWEALKLYGGYESASEAVMRANASAGPLWAQLYVDQLPTVTVRRGL